jgi:hypothetical protein
VIFTKKKKKKHVLRKLVVSGLAVVGLGAVASAVNREMNKKNDN